MRLFIESVKAKISLEPTVFKAVSYTHLDVYKRQGVNITLKERPGNWLPVVQVYPNCKRTGIAAKAGWHGYGLKNASTGSWFKNLELKYLQKLFPEHVLPGLFLFSSRKSTIYWQIRHSPRKLV